MRYRERTLGGDKSDNFRHSIKTNRGAQIMAESQEPKKETVRITLPPRPTAPATGGQQPGRETVRINMPARPPTNGAGSGQPPNRPGPMRPPPPPGSVVRPPSARAPLPPAPSKAVPPPPSFPVKPPPSASAATPPLAAKAPVPPKFNSPVPRPPISDQSISPGPGPKKETARITVLPDPPSRPAGSVQMKKTQPLSTMPEPVMPVTPIKVTPAAVPVHAEPEIEENGVAMGWCWTLLAISAIVLLVQLWNYFS